MRKRRAGRPVDLALVVPLALLLAGTAFAQDLPTLEEPGAKPKPGAQAEVPEAIDVADMVLAAAKAPISIQESPSIISVITREQIQSRGFRTLWDVLATVPGFESYRNQYGYRYPDAMVRGNANVVLVLWNGISITEPNDGTRAMDRRLPLDAVERIEVTSGPGGVLWGANAYLGIVNIVTRDAQGWRGIEAGAGYGTGPGEQNATKLTLSLAERFFNNKLRFYLNGNFWSSDGPRVRLPYDLLMPISNPPQPDGAWIFRPSQSDIVTPRQYSAAVSGSVGLGPVQVDYYVPYERTHAPTNNILVRGDDPRYWNSTTGSAVPCGPLNPVCTSPSAFQQASDTFRLFSARYQDLLLNQKMNLTVRGYYTSFDDVSLRQTGLPVGVFKNPVMLDDHYGTDPRNPRPWSASYRYGGTADATITLPQHNRLIVGGEVFREGTGVRYTGRWTGDDALKREAAYDPDAPGYTLIAYPGQRLVAAAFAHDEWRPVPKLALSAGLRFQHQSLDIDQTSPLAINASGVTTPGYEARLTDHLKSSQQVLLGSAAGTYNLWKKTHVKVNFAQGFRPPRFADLAAPVNAGVAAYPGNPLLGVERSQAIEGELNTVVLERHKGIRKLYLRADYSYTTLSGLIVRPTFLAENAGNRTANSVEFSAHLEGMRGWNFWLNYYFLDLVDHDTGPVRNVARQHLNLGGSLRLLHNKVELNTVVSITGSMDDINRSFVVDPAHAVFAPGGAYQTAAGQLRLDHMPAVALWRVGLWVREVIPKVDLSAYVDNLLNVKWAAPDAEYNARQTPLPIPMPGLSFFLSAWVKL
jgi:outer membrane receptor protein involved in Fe transport